MVEVPGFADPNKTVEISGENDDAPKKKSGKKSGGFQSMNLSFNVLKGIAKRGYKQPTPIQRKVSFTTCLTEIELSLNTKEI